jgi:hypothetical protein
LADRNPWLRLGDRRGLYRRDGEALIGVAECGTGETHRAVQRFRRMSFRDSKGGDPMGKLLLAAAASLAALALPAAPAEAQRHGGWSRHWDGGRHMGWRHMGWHQMGWRDGWRWRDRRWHRPARVRVHVWAAPAWGWARSAPCRRLWWDGWGWRCSW